MPVSGTQRARDPRHVWLVLSELLDRAPPHPRQTVGLAAPLELFERGELRGVCGHHDFSASLVADAVLHAEPKHRLAARRA
jgi:hypothetical protein